MMRVRGSITSCTFMSVTSNMLSRMETCFFGRKLDDSRMMVRISSADISRDAPSRRAPNRRRIGARIASVEAESSPTKGAVASASMRIGQATSRAMPSALCWPRRLGTSSPTTIDR